MHNRSGWWIVIIIMLLLDLYVFQAVKALAMGTTDRTKMVVYITYWSFSAAAVLFFLSFPFWNSDTWPKIMRNYIMAIFIGLFMAKLLAAVFFLIDDTRRCITWIINKAFYPSSPTQVTQGFNLSRSAFISWLGIGVGSTFFATLFYGFRNKYNYQVKRIKLSYKNLPAGFKGLKILHISDIHSGSFTDKAEVEKGISMMLKENAELVLFTGDLVNDQAGEMDNYKDIFSKITAPMGVFSTLGNHDYGDYMSWDSPEAKKQNLENLKDVHRQMGWRLMMNEHIVLERNGDKIALLGIENWGAKGNFPKYGKMKKAYPGTEHLPFKILMSHDPSHWDAEVRPRYPDIDLMLAGHTHGMQFGLESPFMKWSPVQWMYKQWAGLYEEKNQKLYVNRGYGFIGYPGRVGIMPEITVIELV